MKRVFIFLIIFLIFFNLISMIQTITGKQKAGDRINFIDIGDHENLIEIPYKCEGKTAGIVVIDIIGTLEDHYTCKIAIKDNNGTIIDTLFFPSMTEPLIGTIDILNNGTDMLFLDTYSGGSGGCGPTLYLLNIQRLEAISVGLFFPNSPIKKPAEFYYSENCYDKVFQKEKAFLDSIKYEYGYLSEEDIIDDSKYAYYFWIKDNEKYENGQTNYRNKIKTRRYKGTYKDSTIIKTIKDGNIIYTADEHSGIIAYDRISNEHYVIYYAGISGKWQTLITAFRKKRSYLFIGTKPFSAPAHIAVINVKNGNIRIHQFEEFSEIKSIKFSNSKVIINGLKCPFPDF